MNPCHEPPPPQIMRNIRGPKVKEPSQDENDGYECLTASVPFIIKNSSARSTQERRIYPNFCQKEKCRLEKGFIKIHL